MVRGSRSLLILVLVLLVSIIGPFLIWGEWFDRVLTLEGARAWMESLGHWAALGGVLLLVADLFLPIPGTVVMSALGWMYGWWWGGWLAAAGSWLAGVVAYGLSRWVGRPAARWLAGEEGLERAHGLFERRGGWMVA
ncbi:MAG: VTT domain-containing protein, partial [Verrucomicrobiales bacterium]|nr:VTT domain-containing protein [Verrucomicrobiales bacterium]